MRRYVKNLVVLAIAFGMACAKPAPLGVPTSVTFNWLLIAFLLPPSFPFATILVMLTFTLVAVLCAGLLITGLFASIQAYNAAYPGGQLWRLIYLVFEIVIAWLFFLPVAKTGLLGLNFAANSAGLVMLMVEAVRLFPVLSEKFNIWIMFTELVPIDVIMLFIILAVALFVGYPESGLERLKDAEVDILRTLKRLVVAFVAIQANEPAPEAIAERFTAQDAYVAKRRGYPFVGTPFTLDTFSRIEHIIYFEVQELLRQRRAANFEFFVWSRDDPALIKEMHEDVFSLLQNVRSISASAKLVVSLKDGWSPDGALFMQRNYKQTETESKDGAIVWKVMEAALDSMERIINVLDLDQTLVVTSDTATLARMKQAVSDLTDYIFAGSFSTNTSVELSDILMDTSRQLTFIDLFTFCNQLVHVLEKAENIVQSRATAGKWGKFYATKKVKVDEKPFEGQVDSEDIKDNIEIGVKEAQPKSTIEKKGFVYWFLAFCSSDSVVLSNQVATATFLVLVWSVVPFTEATFLEYKMWWIMYPIYYTLCVQSMGSALYRGFFRFLATVLSAIVAIIATLPDYGTNSWSVAVWGFVLFSFYGWISAYAPEFLDIASVGGFCYVYVTWTSFSKPPDPKTFQPGVTGGIRLAMVAVGISIGLLLYIMGRPKYAKSRVRIRCSKMMLDVEAVIDLLMLYARNPILLVSDFKEKRMERLLAETSLDLETTRMDLDQAGGEPSAVYPWSTPVYRDLFANVSDIVARLNTTNNFYKWITIHYQADHLLQNANRAVFAPGRADRIVIWTRNLANCLQSEQPIIPQSREMRELIIQLIRDAELFSSALRGTPGVEVSPDVALLMSKLSPDQLKVRLALSTVAVMLTASVVNYLSRIEADILALYGERQVGTPIGVKLY
jgi:hypothetical protein